MLLLEGKVVTKYFGGLAAVSNVDCNVEQGDTLNEVYRLFPILKARQGKLARPLSGGEQQKRRMAYHPYALSGRKIGKSSANYTSYNSNLGPRHG